MIDTFETVVTQWLPVVYNTKYAKIIDNTLKCTYFFIIIIKGTKEQTALTLVSRNLKYVLRSLY